MTGRRLSFVLLLTTLGAHLVCVSWVATGGLAVADRREVYLPLVASAALAVAMFAMRRVVRVRAATIARAAAVLIAIALLDGPPVFVPALLVAPLLIEPVRYDDDRVGMALAGAFFAAALAVLATRAPAGPPATEHYLATFALVTGLPAGLGWVAAFHRERVVELTARVRSLDSTIGRLARANREFQAYAGTVKSESAAEKRSRITRELHDTVGYALTNVIVMMDAAKARAREDPNPSIPPRRRARSERAGAERHAEDPAPAAFRRAVRAEGDRRDLPAHARVRGAMGLSVELHVGNLAPTLGPRIDSCCFGYGYTDGSWIKVGDEYHLGNTTRAAFELFSFLRELYQAAGLDPDFILNTGGCSTRGSVRHRQGGTDQLPVRARAP